MFGYYRNQKLGVSFAVVFYAAYALALGEMALVIMLHDFLCFPVYGMSFGVQSVTSYNLGAGLMEREAGFTQTEIHRKKPTYATIIGVKA